MKRVLCTGVSVVVLAMAALAGSSQGPLPRANDEWQQEQWDTAGAGQGEAIGSAGTMPPPDLLRGRQEARQRIAEMQRRAEQMQREVEERRNRAIQEMLGATDEQWRRLRPRLDRIERLKDQANASIDLGALSGSSSFFFNNGQSFGGQWGASFGGGGAASGSGGFGQPGQNRTWQRSWNTGMPQANRTGGPGTQTDALCQELLRLLQTPNTPAAQISQKVMALRQAKEQAGMRLRRERSQLREQITQNQEPALILMGYLD